MYSFASNFSYYRSSQHRSYENIDYVVDISPQGAKTRISRIGISIRSREVDISCHFDDGGRATSIVVNGAEIIDTLEVLRFSISTGMLFPDARFSRNRDESISQRDLFNSHGIFVQQIQKILRNNLDSRIMDKRIIYVAERIVSFGLPSKSYLRELSTSQGKIVGDLLSDIGGQDIRNLFSTISRSVYASALPSIFRAVSARLRAIMGSSLYIGPARARSERYYRYQDLSVSEIDSDGKNFPMFLNSLTARQIGDLSSWISSLFGYGVSVSRQEGHISIILTDGDYRANVVDVGYGVSQILPVLGQMWWASDRLQRSAQSAGRGSILTIEQPELHLHPAHQALLADALVGATEGKSPSARLSYIVETHSETLVNRLGELIAAGRIAADDVQIVLFESQSDASVSSVRTVRYDKDGVLVDWPYGFFQSV